jgi:hypothetical protein
VAPSKGKTLKFDRKLKGHTMAHSISCMPIAMDYVHSRSIPSNPVWDMEAMGDNGTEIPPSASKFILVTISTTDVMCIKNAVINISLTTIRH